MFSIRSTWGRLAALSVVGTLALALVPRGAVADGIFRPRTLSFQDNPPPRDTGIVTEEVAAVSEERAKPSQSDPFYKQWWFWPLTATVVAGIVVAGLLARGPSEQVKPVPCLPGVICFGAGRS
jgi:hypothetical protein